MNYEITKDGKIYKDGKEKKQSNHSQGYKVVWIDGKNIRVHRLVAEKFIPNPNNLPYVNHVNGIKSDNRVENLEWVTPQKNVEHSVVTGLRIKNRKLTTELANQIRSEYRLEYKDGGPTQKELANKYGVSRSAIKQIIQNKSYKY
jgi:hypothetical protein